MVICTSCKGKKWLKLSHPANGEMPCTLCHGTGIEPEFAGYMQKLRELPEPLRAQMLTGDFSKLDDHGQPASPPVA